MSTYEAIEKAKRELLNGNMNVLKEDDSNVGFRVEQKPESVIVTLMENEKEVDSIEIHYLMEG